MGARGKSISYRRHNITRCRAEKGAGGEKATRGIKTILAVLRAHVLNLGTPKRALWTEGRSDRRWRKGTVLGS